MGVSQGFESYNYIVNQWFAWHDSFLLSHHFKRFPNKPKSIKPKNTALCSPVLIFRYPLDSTEIKHLLGA